MNPHRQRLLSAAARVAKVDNKQKEAEGATVPKKPKAKAKAPAKAKVTKVPKVKDVQEAAQSAYTSAKKAFMTGFLARFQDNNQQNTVIYYLYLFFYGT